MRMRLELLDTWRRRIATFTEAAHLDAVRRGPDRFDALECALPHVPGIGPGCLADLYLDGAHWRRFEITRTAEDWDGEVQLAHNPVAPTRDRMRLWARTAPQPGNTRVMRAYVDTSLVETLADIIQRAPGPLHYHVTHTAYPEGAVREHEKFVARATPANALEPGGIARGQWVGADRIDASGAWAKDGDTIAGVVVDGVAWPELRLMMIDAEETTLNNHARKRHPETALWTPERYARSGYKLRADAAADFLAQLMNEEGISHIELNPHRDATGAFDDRVDVYGRYIALVFGGGMCFNAALVETGHADVYLYADGRYHVPGHALKDYYSYTGAHTAGLYDDGLHVNAIDLDCGALEAVTALMMLSGNRVFTVSPEMTLRMHAGDAVTRTPAYEAERMSLRSGFVKRPMINWLALQGNRQVGPERFTAARGDSIGAYGLEAGWIDAEWAGDADDLEGVALGLLEDLAYPTPVVELVFFDGAPDMLPGELVRVAGAHVTRHARRLDGEWGGRFEDGLVGRVAEVRHRFEGAHAETIVTLTAPLRSVANPYLFLRRMRNDRETPFTLRLDEEMVGLDQDRFFVM